MNLQTTQTVDLLLSQRQVTPEGFLRVPARIARTGIQEYRAFELGLTDGDPTRVIRVYRPPEEVFHPTSMASFEGKTVTDNHPDTFVSVDNWKELARGHATAVRRDGDYLVADLMFTHQDAIAKLDAGKEQLSNGYDAEYDWTPGVTPGGQPYDAVQRNIRGNHIALVDVARCGPTCRVSDSQQQGEVPMGRRVTVDGIPFDLDEAAAAAVEKMQQRLHDSQAKLQRTIRFKARDAVSSKPDEVALEDEEGLQAKVDGLEKDNEALVKDAAALRTELEQARKDVVTPAQRDAMVASWAKLIQDAQALVPELVTDGKTCAAIRKEVVDTLYPAHQATVDAVLGGKALATADADAVRVAFNVLAAQAPSTGARPGTKDGLGLALLGGTTTADAADDPRAAMMDAASKAWERK